MKTIGDLIQACLQGHKPILKVIGYVWDEFELDEGCLLRITGYTGVEDGTNHFRYNFDEFKEYNRKLLQPNWNLSGGRKGTAEEWGAWDIGPKVGLYLGDSATDLLSDSGLELHSDQNNRTIIEAEIARLEKELASQKEALASLPKEEPDGNETST
jgi:hypothetical protein